MVTLFLGIGAVLPAADAPAPPARQATASVSAKQVKKWVTDLNSERFYDREVATEKLIAAGAIAVSPVAEAVAENNLEVTTRCIYILQELALSVDPRTEGAAHGALMKMAESRGTATGRRAAATLGRLNSIRHDRALGELKRLGANVGSVSSHFGVPYIQRRSIEIGETWRGEDKDLVRLGWLHDVDELVLQGPLVNDQWLKHAAKVSGLQNLTIKRAEITDEGIKHLSVIKELKTLALMYLPISDQSVQTLKELKAFTEMKIYGCRVTPAGASELKRALPTTDLDYRRGGFLGIQCHPDQQRCVVVRVVANSAAHKAGLIVNDVIYEYEGKRVGNFERLTALIAENRPGDTVTMKIMRNDQKLTKEVTLGEWD